MANLSKSITRFGIVPLVSSARIMIDRNQTDALRVQGCEAEQTTNIEHDAVRTKRLTVSDRMASLYALG